MPARSSSGAVRIICVVACLGAAACSAGDTSVDPGDLELRDVLGISPDVAAEWSAAQRAAARRVLDGGLHGDDDGDAAWQGTIAGDVDTIDMRVAHLLASGDAARDAGGLPALGVVRVVIDASPLSTAPAAQGDSASEPRRIADRAPREPASAAPAPQTSSIRGAPAASEPGHVADVAPQEPRAMAPTDSITAAPAASKPGHVADVAPQEAHAMAPSAPTDSSAAAAAATERRHVAEIARRPAPLAAAVLAANTPAAEPLAAAHPHTEPASGASSPAADNARGAAAPVELRFVGWNLGRRWDALSDRGAGLLTALAADAGHPGGPLAIVPAPRLAVIAAYVRQNGDRAPPHLLINPVALAAIEPAPGASDAAASGPGGEAGVARASGVPSVGVAVAHGGATPPVAGSTTIASTGGNPYSFYGSVAECAFAQRSRCEACLPASNCRPITNISDGNAECAMLGAESGRGYFLLCINLSLAISSVDRCTGDAAPACVRDPDAADTLATLENNADFLADPSCGGALDGCLAQIYGTPGGQFPGLDAGTTSSEPPRSTSVSCSNSCNNNQNTSCSASPSCDCSGPSCNNSLSCDSACSSSNDQRGCGGNCNACTSSGGGGGNGGGGCGGGSSSSSGGSCSSGSGSSDSSGCGNSCSSSSSGSNSGCSGGGCSGGSGSGCSGGGCSSGSGGSSCGGSGGGGGKCSVAAVDPAPGIGFALSALWGGLPIALAAFARRRAHRRRRPHPADTPRPPIHQPRDAEPDAGASTEGEP